MGRLADLMRTNDQWSSIHLRLEPREVELLYWYLCLADYPATGPRFQEIQRIRPKLLQYITLVLED